MVKPEGGQKGDERHTYMVLAFFGGDVLSERSLLTNYNHTLLSSFHGFVVFLGEAHIPHVLRVHPFQRGVTAGLGPCDAISVLLALLIMVGVVLRLGHFNLLVFEYKLTNVYDD